MFNFQSISHDSIFKRAFRVIWKLSWKPIAWLPTGEAREFAGDGSSRSAGSSRVWQGANFENWKFPQDGITLLLVVILLSAIMSIGLGIFNVVIGELKISGEISDSFIAFYTADQEIEKVLYLDRVLGTVCPTPGDSCFTESNMMDPPVEARGCYTARVSKADNNTDIVVAGQYRCGPNPARVVKRGFEVTY